MELSDLLVAAAKGDKGALESLPEDFSTHFDSFGIAQLLFSVEEKLGIDLPLESVDLGDIVKSAKFVLFLKSHLVDQTDPDAPPAL